MIPGMVDNRDPDSLASRMRRRRMRWFIRLLDDFPEPVRVLDVGGTREYWIMNSPRLPRRCRITLLNLTAVPVEGLPDTVSVAGDARRMPQFADREFDICFSNSVIEHVGSWADQESMAREVRRVAKAWFVQTPNRHFPLEPHFVFPGWQYFPVRLRAALHRRFDLGWMPRQPDPILARAEVERIRLLTASEMVRLFPDGRLVREMFGPFTKSLIALGRRGVSSPS
jgi:hypothetical protein